MARVEQAYTAELRRVVEEARMVQGIPADEKEALVRVVDVIVREVRVLDDVHDPMHKATRDEVLMCNSRALQKAVPRVLALLSLGKVCAGHNYSAPLRILSWNLIANWGAGLAPDAGGFEGVSRDEMCMLNRVFQQAFIVGKSGASVVGVVELDYEPIFTCLLGLLGYRKLAFHEKVKSQGLHVREELQLNEARGDGAALYVHSSILASGQSALAPPYLVLDAAAAFTGIEHDFKPEYVSNGGPRVQHGRTEGLIPTGASEMEFAKSSSKPFRQIPLIAKLRLILCSAGTRRESDIVFALAHLTAKKHWGGEADRVEQFQQLEQRAKALADDGSTPIVLMGDFNADNQSMEVKGITDSFYKPQLFPYIHSQPRVRPLCHPQLDFAGRVRRVTSRKTRMMKGVTQTYAYTPDRIMAYGIEFSLDSSILMGLTYAQDADQALAQLLQMPSALMPSDHEPVLVSSSPGSYVEDYFHAFPLCIDQMIGTKRRRGEGRERDTDAEEHPAKLAKVRDRT